jgi:hypothetical protein
VNISSNINRILVDSGHANIDDSSENAFNPFAWWSDDEEFYYIGSAEGHEYPDLQVGDEVNPRPFFVCS